jgi:RND superfamily putative drug exporter
MLAWVGAFVAVAALAAILSGDQLQIAGYSTPGSESTRVADRLHDALGYDPEPAVVAYARAPGPISRDPGRAAIARLAARLRAEPGVAHVQTPLGRDGLAVLGSRDGEAALILVHFRSTDVRDLKGSIARLRKLRVPGLQQLRFGGYAVGELELNDVARKDLVRAELIAVPILALLIFLVFRGLVASAIPLAIGGVSMAGAYTGLQLIGRFVDVSILALNLAVLLSLGLAVDYALLLVSRYREEVVEHGPGVEARRATLRSAGRAVAFSGLAVAAACAPLMAFSQGFVYSMGIAGTLVPLLSAAFALLITFPLLALVGGRIAPHAAPPAGHTGWFRWAKWVMRHPGDRAAVGVLVLIAAAAPILTAKSTFPDRTTVPRGTDAREVAELSLGQFPNELAAPVSLVAGPRGWPGRVPAEKFAQALNLFGGVEVAGPLVGPSGRAVGAQAVLRQPPTSETSQEVVRRLRALDPELLVGGRTAQFIDLKHSIHRRILVAGLLVVLLTFGVLATVTRSVLLPVKALAFHALVLAATFGLLVLIFQRDALGLGGLVGYDGPRALDLLVGVVILASTFGLAADYSILLLARITEEHRAGRDDEEAVALGIERTGPVITSAAAVLVVTLLALTTSKLYLIKELTVGQIIGVTLDVSIVRLVLVPAFIRLLGPLNWWYPHFLRRRTEER